MMRNRPVVVKGMAKDWDATKKWSDFNYLRNNAGNSPMLASILTSRGVAEGEKPDWSLLKVRPHKFPTTLDKALTGIEDNKDNEAAKMVDGVL